MSSELEFSVGEVAAMLGMTPSAIRVWERRHQAVAPRRTPGGQRRYSVDDVAELHRIKSLVASGGRSVRLATLESRGVGPPPSTGATPAGEPSTTSEVTWKAVADHIPLLVIFVTTDGRVVDVNRAVVDAFGAVAGDLSERRFADLVEPHDRAKAVRLYSATPVERRGWELNLNTSPPGTYTFDSWLVGEPTGTTIVLIGHAVECAEAESSR